MTFPTTSHYPAQNSGPCNSFNCSGHFKNVYDDDDDCDKQATVVDLLLIALGDSGIADTIHSAYETKLDSSSASAR